MRQPHRLGRVTDELAAKRVVNHACGTGSAMQLAPRGEL